MRRRIFVFGSNLMGYHGGGAAKYAREECGAVEGVGEGLTGESYALPTCTAPGVPMSMHEVGYACQRFKAYAISHPELDFLLTAVGCGIAGFSADDVGFLFGSIGPQLPDNVYVQAKLAYGMVP